MRFSVIVPVYGTEKYLDQCVESVLAQSFTDFELILVDDCSPDNCPAMCDEWAEKDSRIKVIHHQVNEGMAVGRNHGMEIAAGDYILFLDSDDYMAENSLEQFKFGLCENADILAMGANCVYEKADGRTDWIETLTVEGLTANTPDKIAEAFVRLTKGRVFPFVWNKAFRREFLASYGAAFEKEWISEDLIFNLEAFFHADSVVVLDKAVYFYRRTARETMVTKYRPEFFALCKRKYRLECRLLKRCGAETGDNLHIVQTAYVKHIISAVMRNRSKSARLSLKKQLSLTREMLNDPLTREVLASYEPRGVKMKLVTILLRRKMAFLCLLVGAAADLAQRRFTKVFKKLLIR